MARRSFEISVVSRQLAATWYNQISQTIMKKIKLIIFTLVMLCGLTALAQKPNRIIIFNGYFFNELPAAVKNSGTPQDMNYIK